MTTTQHPAGFDDAKAEAFAGQLLATLNHGALCLMASIGHRTGLFDAMRGLPPATSAEIARCANLDERYVREWLGALVTAGVVEVDRTSTRYRLPAEHAASLTRAAAADNIAVFTQYIAVMGGVEDDIVECFRHGGGVPYARFPRFHAVMQEDSGQSVLSSLESHVLPLVPGLTDRLATGIRVLDVGCGSGRIVNRLAGLYPNSTFTGLDFSEEAIGNARAEAARQGLRNTAFIVRDLRIASLKIALCGGACLTNNRTRRWWIASEGGGREVADEFPGEARVAGPVCQPLPGGEPHPEVGYFG